MVISGRMCKEGQSPLMQVDQLFPSADVVVTPIIKGTANLCADGHVCAIGHGRKRQATKHRGYRAWRL